MINHFYTLVIISWKKQDCTKGDMSVGKVDYVMIESTYGDRIHPNRKDVEKIL